jgi:hypothetical protein
VRKFLVVPTLLSLAVAPAAMALPSDQSFSEGAAASRSAAPPAGNAYPVLARHGQAAPPKPGRSPRKSPAAPAVAVPPQLQAIASCESGGNPAAVDSTGTYRGKYQFSTATWQGIGGTGDPAAASEAEQDRRAAMLYARSGAGQWPVCGQ